MWYQFKQMVSRFMWRRRISKRIDDNIRAMHRLQDLGWSVGYLDMRQDPKIYETVDDVPEFTRIDDIQQVIYLKHTDEQSATEGKDTT